MLNVDTSLHISTMTRGSGSNSLIRVYVYKMPNRKLSKVFQYMAPYNLRYKA